MFSRRNFLWASSAAALFPFPDHAQQHPRTAPAGAVPPAIAALPNLTSQAKPFTNDERLARIERARQLMAQHNIDAIILANNAKSSVYFANIRLGGSERLWALVIPAKAKPFIVCPAFEEDRARELLESGPFGKDADILTWQEDEDPFALTVKGLRDRGIATGTVGLDENMKFIFAESLAAAGPALHFVSAVPFTAGCRMIKSQHELDCMALACRAIINHVVMIDPIDAHLYKAKSVDNEHREHLAQSIQVREITSWPLKLKHHDGNDHSDHTVRECGHAPGCELRRHLW